VTNPPPIHLTPDAVHVNLRAARAGALILTFVLVGGLFAAAVYGAIDAADAATRVIAIVIAALLLIPLWMTFWLVSHGALKPSGIAFDARGVHYWRATEGCMLPWQEVAAIGIGYETPPNLPSVPASLTDVLSAMAVDKVKDAIRLKDLRKVALEIYPVDPGMVSRYPLFAPYWRQYPAQFDGLPPVRVRLPLPPFTGVARTVTQAITHYQPQRSLGWFKRPCTGGLFGAGKGK
jgi:hypothetical protein